MPAKLRVPISSRYGTPKPRHLTQLRRYIAKSPMLPRRQLTRLLSRAPQRSISLSIDPNDRAPRLIQPSSPSAEPNNQAAAGTGIGAALVSDVRMKSLYGLLTVGCCSRT